MRSWLTPGEQVIVISRPQARSLFWPAVFVVLIPMAGGMGLAWLSRVPWDADTQPWQSPATIGVLFLAGILLLFYPVRRYFRWLSTRYILTSRRIVVRGGLLRRRNRDVPLYTLRTLSTHQGILQRILRSGNITLISGVDETMLMRDIPEVMKFKNLALEAIAELPHSQFGEAPPISQRPQQIGFNGELSENFGGEESYGKR
ncbi:membrane protein YdbS with pleckstrin-like domain [Psychromicrobium silvestre]|uniref:Membrane protein YdbS with pleckstrin-like domain n=1 Tax=Psychromicrobium silvestre TaxID=1645614 RepID=A0A7Y9LVY8_9MICC|nr:PH domain-containing protein [Psychromicrobium silvestre]NYE96608.1 membrane protein YdbS with pleckstrin-like domain [Psychromicrobium silvestre]